MYTCCFISFVFVEWESFKQLMLHVFCMCLFSALVTITHNNRCSEMLAMVRRGPFAIPTAEEKIEYLLGRVKKSDTRKDLEKHSFEHVSSLV